MAYDSRLGQFSKEGPKRVPYYSGNLNRDPNLDNYPLAFRSLRATKNLQSDPEASETLRSELQEGFLDALCHHAS